MAYKDPEEFKKYNKEYMKKKRSDPKYKEEEKERARLYSKTIKGKYKEYRSNASRRGYNFPLTLDEFSTFWQKPCYYCGDPIDTIGLDRIDNNIGYVLDNVISCCSWCNRMKLEYGQKEFLDHIEKIYLRSRGVI